MIVCRGDNGLPLAGGDPSGGFEYHRTWWQRQYIRTFLQFYDSKSIWSTSTDDIWCLSEIVRRTNICEQKRARSWKLIRTTTYNVYSSYELPTYRSWPLPQNRTSKVIHVTPESIWILPTDASAVMVAHRLIRSIHASRANWTVHSLELSHPWFPMASFATTALYYRSPLFLVVRFSAVYYVCGHGRTMITCNAWPLTECMNSCRIYIYIFVCFVFSPIIPTLGAVLVSGIYKTTEFNLCRKTDGFVSSKYA